jgi:protein-S-isoprenylcysteine O-methyltransferase Ste14
MERSERKNGVLEKIGIAAMTSRFAAIVIGFVSTAAWLGLAVWGWGGWAGYFANPARTALVAITFLLVLASVFTSGNLSTGEKEDRGNRWVLWLMIPLGFLDGWLPADSDRTEFLTFGGDGVRWAGVFLFAAGGALRIWPVFVLGRRFSGLVAIQKGHALVTDGIYRTIRNPSYLGLLIGVFGWGLAFRSVPGLVLAALFIPPLVGRMHSEEALLAGHFGAAYDAYRAHTWRLVPHVY